MDVDTGAAGNAVDRWKAFTGPCPQVVTMPGAASAAVGISSTAAAINNPLSFMANSSYELERRSEADVP